jgi:anti-sigma factor RsiW
VNCSEAETLIAAQLDGELDAMRGRGLVAHLAGCAACAAERASLVELKARIGGAAPYHRAPPPLRHEVERLLVDAAHREPPPWRATAPSRRVFAAGALAGAATLGIGWLAGAAWLEWRDDSDLAHLLVDAHVRATLGEHRIDVASSDQHTVKPWLSARLDYSPAIVEAPVEGVTLVGARIEAIERQRIATLVYRYRAHWIDVFVRPGGRVAAAETARTIRGFNVVQASGDGMEWRAVSDAGLDVLQRLVARLARTPAQQP